MNAVFHTHMPEKSEKAQQVRLILLCFLPEQDKQVTVMSIHCEFERIHLENNSHNTEVFNVINRHWETGPGSESKTTEVARVNEKRAFISLRFRMESAPPPWLNLERYPVPENGRRRCPQLDEQPSRPKASVGIERHRSGFVCRLRRPHCYGQNAEQNSSHTDADHGELHAFFFVFKLKGRRDVYLS